MILNGKYVPQDEPIRVLDFVRGYKLSRHVAFVQINGVRVPKDAFETTYIHDKDEVVFTTMVSGG